MLQPLRRLIHNQSGAFAVWFGLSLLPLFLLAGVAVDVIRAVNLRSQLQSAVDAAALAGATVYVSTATSTTATTVATRYMTSAIANLSVNEGVTYTVTPTVTTSGGSNSLYTVTVAATSIQTNSLLAFFVPTTTIGVTAQAQNPVYKVTFTLSSFSSSAADANSIYWYIVPSDSGVPATTDLTLLYSNTSSSNTKTVSASVTAGQKVGFALKNVTGGITGYGRNGYGASQSTSHYFYSHLMPPSSQSYSSVTKDCNIQIGVSGTTSSIKSGSCLTALPTYSALNCAQASGKTMTYYWNDMGGSSDDMDYNDAVYKVYCAANASTSQTGVTLVK